MSIRMIRRLSTVATLIVVLAVATIASGHGTVPFTDPNVIHACRNQNSGSLRQIVTGICANGETIVHWNITGPAGTNGTNGTNGVDGTNGTNGTNGVDGTNGTNGINGIDGTNATDPDPPCLDDTNRYVNCGNGTVTDTVTGLIWLQDAGCLGSAEWPAANGAAAALANGSCGLTDGSSAGDWRLPTKDEWSATIARARTYAFDSSGFATLAGGLGCTFMGEGSTYPSGTADETHLPPSLTNDAGTGCQAVGPSSFAGVASEIYWSSTTDEVFPIGAWVVTLRGGNIGPFLKSGQTFRVWPVRGGPR